jgi:hypothetical protein
MNMFILCPKSLTQEHEWKDNLQETNHPLKDLHGNTINYPICIFCGIIDTRKEKDDSSL